MTNVEGSLSHAVATCPLSWIGVVALYLPARRSHVEGAAATLSGRRIVVQRCVLLVELGKHFVCVARQLSAVRVVRLDALEISVSWSFAGIHMTPILLSYG